MGQTGQISVASTRWSRIRSYRRPAVAAVLALGSLPAMALALPAQPASATTGPAIAYMTDAPDGTVIPIYAGYTLGTPISVGACCPQPGDVAITPDGSTAYVANGGGDTISVIPTATNKVVDTITVGNGPAGMAISPDGSTVYVPDQSAVSVIRVINCFTMFPA